MPVEILILLQVILVDICLSGDNAVVIAMTTWMLEPKYRPLAMSAGIFLAIVMRILLCFITTRILQFTLIKLLGGFMLFWVCWEMYQDIKKLDENKSSSVKSKNSFWWAIFQILIADLSMSVDNILAIAAIAQNHPVTMAIGLFFSIAFMGIAAIFITKLMERFPWVKYVGLGLVLYIATKISFEALWSIITK